MKITQLGYIGIDVTEIGAWRDYATRVLGLEESENSDEQTLYLRMDENHHRLALHVGESDDVSYLGLQTRNRVAMEAVAERVEGAGVEVHVATPEEAARRRVVDFVSFDDPYTGVRMEVFFGLEVVFVPSYKPSRAITGFKTGSLGMGHVLLYVSDAEKAAQFYQDALGFGVTDWILNRDVGMTGVFLHANGRHHTLAVTEHPDPPRRLNHLMLEMLSIDDVGLTYDICHEEGLDVTTIGRHLNDHMISFYFHNPSGKWMFEFGWGSRLIDPETWNAEFYDVSRPASGEWGHKGAENIV